MNKNEIIDFILQLPLPAAHFEASGKVVCLNSAFTKLLGYTAADIPTVEAHWPLFFPDVAYREKVQKDWVTMLEESAKTGIPIQPMLLDIVAKNGEVKKLEVHSLQVGNLAITMHIDFTERLKNENELKNAKVAAETANRAKSIFLANMSHELRTPLNAILGFSDIMRKDENLSAAQHESLNIIHKSGDHLLGLINDVLDIAKIEASHIVLNPKPFDLGAMVLDLTDMLRIRAQEKGLQLLLDQHSEFPRFIVGDEAKLRQIFINLLSNAIKATEEGGVTLRLGLKHNHAEHLLVEVEDTGSGISAADQAKLFQPFMQIGSQNKQQGTGLGLAITKQFVELMGGTISLTSTVGQGSTFRVDVLVQLAQAEEIPQSFKVSGEVTGLAPGQPLYRVLVVDDQEDNWLLLERLLGSVGFEVEIAQNGAEAVEKFQHWHPHFIWMDRRMPVLDGMEATRRIRALPEGDKVRIAAVTASTFREEDEQLTAAGFDDIVHKPFRANQIFDCMEQLLGVRFTRAEAETEITPATELSAEAMTALPEELRKRFKLELSRLDSERIMVIIDEIAMIDAELAVALRALAEDYDYPSILALLRSNLAGHGKAT
ncbi:MAG: ATP-binding protein [Pseudomonadota bacterium]